MKFLLLFTLLFASVSQAADTQVLLDLPLNQVSQETKYANLSTTQFRIDFEHNEVFGDLIYTRETYRCSGHGEYRDCFSNSDVIKTYSAKLEGMSLFDDKVILHTVNGEVECGVIKPGRIFRNRKNLLLNGNCKLDSKEIKLPSGEKRLQFFLLVK